MSYRYMYDVVGSGASGLVHFQPVMVAGYDTGSAGLQWSQTDWDLFPSATRVHIDQAGNGAPVHSATVMDVEPGCYTVGEVQGWTSACTAERPTVYCTRGDLSAVETVWHGDIWLAAPGVSDDAYAAHPQIVAVQNVWAGSYDRSVVYDPEWPSKKGSTVPPGQPRNPVECVVTWDGHDGLTSRKTDIPWEAWSKLLWKNPF